MVLLELDESLSVTVTKRPPNSCAYTVVYEGEQVAQYETSADPRTTGGHVSLRNVVRRNVPGYEKTAVGERLAAVIEKHTDALAEELGPL